jgi:hypothetical protein
MNNYPPVSYGSIEPVSEPTVPLYLIILGIIFFGVYMVLRWVKWNRRRNCPQCGSCDVFYKTGETKIDVGFTYDQRQCNECGHTDWIKEIEWGNGG